MIHDKRRDELKQKEQRAGLTPAERREYEQLLAAIPGQPDNGTAIIRGHKAIGRTAAKKFTAQIAEAIAEVGDLSWQTEFLGAFWDELIEFVEQNAPVIPRLPHIAPMTDREANEFAADFMPFGKFKGEQIWTIPLKYLDGIQGLQATFSGRLARFLVNEKVAEQLRIELERSK